MEEGHVSTHTCTSGALSGCPAEQIGKSTARAARDCISDEIRQHLGHFVVIDDMFSDEVCARLDAIIKECLTRACENGHFALRVHDCEGGAEPYERWEPFAEANEPVVFYGSVAAARYIARSEVTRSPIPITSGQ